MAVCRCLKDFRAFSSSPSLFPFPLLGEGGGGYFYPAMWAIRGFDTHHHATGYARWQHTDFLVAIWGGLPTIGVVFFISKIKGLRGLPEL